MNSAAAELRSASNRASVIDLEKRISAVESMLLKGFSTRAVVQFAAQNWGIGRRQTQSYIERARERVEKHLRRNAETERALILGQLEHLYFQAIHEKRDLYLARLIIMDRAKLYGLL